MGALLNQHSFIVGSVLVLGGLWFVLRRRGRWLRWTAIGATVVLLGLAFAGLRTGAGNVRTPSDLDAALASDEPVVLEFFSNY